MQVPPNGSFPQIRTEDSLVMAVARKKYIWEIEPLITPANINAKLYGETALHRAVRDDNVNLARLLVEKGADPLITITGKTITALDLVQTPEMREVLSPKKAPVVEPTSFLTELFGFDLHPTDVTPQELLEGFKNQQRLVAHGIRLLDEYQFPDEKPPLTQLRAQALVLLKVDNPPTFYPPLSLWSSFPYDAGTPTPTLVKHPAVPKYGLAHVVHIGDVLDAYKQKHNYPHTLLPELYHSGFLNASTLKRVQDLNAKTLACKDAQSKINEIQKDLDFVLQLECPGSEIESTDRKVIKTLWAAAISKMLPLHQFVNLPPDLHDKAERLLILLKNKDCTTAELAAVLQDKDDSKDDNWIDQPWSKLTGAQQKEAKEAYRLGLEAARKARRPTAGQKRLAKEHAAYLALLVKPNAKIEPLFDQFLDAQWEHLLKNPEKLEGLYNQDKQTSSCPLMLLTDAADSTLIWVEHGSCQVVNGYVVGAKIESANTSKLKAREIAAKIKEIHADKQKCVVLKQKGYFGKGSTVTFSAQEAGLEVKKKSPTKERVPEPREEASTAATTSTATERTNSHAVSILLPETTTYETGDFLLDHALNTLESARFSLTKREERRMLLFAGDSWPEAKLKERVNTLPQKAAEHIPLLSHKLKPYQVEAVRWIREWTGKGLAGLIAADAGLGKTLICLNHIFQEMAQYDDPTGHRPVLILCKKILVNQWVGTFHKELAEVDTRLQNQLKEDAPDIWIKRLEEAAWRSKISPVNAKEIADSIEQLKKSGDTFYPKLFSLFIFLVKQSGNEGRTALIELFKPLAQYDSRLVFLAAQRICENLTGEALDAAGLKKTLATKPRVVVTTPEALEKLEGAKDLYFSWVIIDEADQVISGADDHGNSELKTIFDAWTVNANAGKKKQNRLLVTATPIRNSITDAWKLFELVNGSDENGRKFFNQLLFAKEEFLKGLATASQGKAVDMDELFAIASRLHQRIRYLREILKPLTYTAHRDDAAIIEQWEGRIPKVNRVMVPITLNEPQNALLARANAITTIFKRYHFEMKLKQHPDLIEDGKYTLIDKDSAQFTKLKTLAQTNPQALIDRSPLWTALMKDLLDRVQKGQKSLIICHHIIPQELLKMVISSHFAQYNVLVEAINGSSDEDAKVVLGRFKSAQNRPAVLLLINKSGGAGLDFPDAVATYMMGQEWNDASTEQIEARILRVGVSGTKDIVYFNANLAHETHMLETSKMKRLWADLALSFAPTVASIVPDMKQMLSACITEFSAKVKDGSLITAAQKERLEQFLEQMMQKVEDEKLEIHEAYKACCPNWKEPPAPVVKAKTPPPPPQILACVPHYMPLDNCWGLEFPFRGSRASAVQLGCLILFKNGIHEDLANHIIAAYKSKKDFPCEPARAWLKKHAAQKFDMEAMGVQVLIFKADGSSKIEFTPKEKKMTLRLIEHADGTFSPFIKFFTAIQ